MALPVIIDTDPGVDDAAAILLALASPELDVRAITVVGGNVPLAASCRNALKLVEVAERTDVPVHAGAPGPLVRPQVFGRYAHIGPFDDAILPPPTTKLAPGHAVAVIVATALAAVTRERPDPRALALVGVLAALVAALRLLGTGVGGLEPMFFLLVLAGASLGPSLGFTLGALAMLNSSGDAASEQFNKRPNTRGGAKGY